VIKKKQHFNKVAVKSGVHWRNAPPRPWLLLIYNLTDYRSVAALA